MKNRIELLAPAGSIEKLKIAVMYGADAVYIGGKFFSLRARANNFTFDDLKEGVDFAHQHKARVYVTMNVAAREEDFNECDLEEYLKYLQSIHVDGIIVSSMYIASFALNHTPNLEVHLSTQASITNSDSVNYYADLGIKRVVLAREVNLEQIKTLTKKAKVGLEVFIHGGMCSSFSGRCMLSNYYVNRDANRGGCAHSCRWNYDLYKKGIFKEKLVNKGGYFNIASKDLCAVTLIKDLIEAGVESLKIEGRMKSEYYIATVVRCYRKLIDAIYNNEDIDYNYYLEEIKKAENRETSTGFLKGDVTLTEQLYDSNDHPTKEFVGYVLGYDEDSQIATIEQRNNFKVGDTLEFFGPHLENTLYLVKEMTTQDGEAVSVAPHPKQVLLLKTDFLVTKGDMIRKKMDN